MIDKYKPPRTQRLVPWRSERTATAMGFMWRDAERRIAEAATRVGQSIAARLAAFVLQSMAAEHALESGAMPRDLHPRELRADWG